MENKLKSTSWYICIILNSIIFLFLIDTQWDDYSSPLSILSYLLLISGIVSSIMLKKVINYNIKTLNDKNTELIDLHSHLMDLSENNRQSLLQANSSMAKQTDTYRSNIEGLNKEYRALFDSHESLKARIIAYSSKTRSKPYHEIFQDIIKPEKKEANS